MDEVTIIPAAGDPPAPLVIATSDGTGLSVIPTGLHAEVQAILDTGLDIAATLDGPTLRLQLIPDENDGDGGT